MNLRNFPRFLGIGALFLIFSLSSFGAELPSFEVPEPEEEPQVTAECCYVHPNFVGVCQVVPAEDETCDGILQYLNTPATVGKTYCDNTRIRGGWEQVSCPGAD
jgi:hypothetical protein